MYTHTHEITETCTHTSRCILLSLSIYISRARELTVIKNRGVCVTGNYPVGSSNVHVASMGYGSAAIAGQLRVERCTFTENAKTSIIAGNLESIRISNSLFRNNAPGLLSAGGALIAYQDTSSIAGLLEISGSEFSLNVNNMPGGTTRDQVKQLSTSLSPTM